MCNYFCVCNNCPFVKKCNVVEDRPQTKNVRREESGNWVVELRGFREVKEVKEEKKSNNTRIIDIYLF
jgi:hypothetical protein